MPLRSKLFRDDSRLQSCLVSDPAHVQPGATGDFVAKIQFALTRLDRANVSSFEMSARQYGPTTAAAVLAYKTRRNIINTSYQTKPDNIVGKMTIASLDAEMVQREQRTRIVIDEISYRINDDRPNVA